METEHQHCKRDGTNETKRRHRLLQKQYNKTIKCRQRSVQFPTGTRLDRWRGGPPSFPSNPGAICPGIRRPEYEADHSPPPNTDAKNTWTLPLLTLYTSMAWCLGTGETLPFMSLNVRNPHFTIPFN